MNNVQQLNEQKIFKNSIKNKIYNILDIYPQEFSLLFKKEKKYTTTLGFIIGIISIIFFSFISIIQLKSIFSEQNYSLITNTLYSENAKVNLTNIPFFFSLLDFNLALSMNIDYMVKVVYLQNNISGMSEQEINITKCNYSELIKKYPSIISFDKKNILDFFYCLDTTKEIVIYGNTGNNEYSYLSFYFYKCLNSSDINTCTKYDNINNILLNTYLLFGYFKPNINNYNYSNPIYYSFQIDNFQFTTSIIKQYNYYFSRVEFESDDGLFLNNIKHYNVFNIESSSIDFLIPNDLNLMNVPLFGQVNFIAFDSINQIKRIYLKLPDVIANIHGIINISYIIINFILSFFTRKILRVDIVNTSLFDVNKKEIYSKSKKSLKFQNTIKKKNDNDNKSSSNNKFNFTQDNCKNYLKQINKINIFNNNKENKIQNERINLKFYQYFLPFFLQKKNKDIIFLKYYINKIKDCISIETIFNKLDLYNKKIT